jgi:hypothetical protein
MVACAIIYGPKMEQTLPNEQGRRRCSLEENAKNL